MANYAGKNAVFKVGGLEVGDRISWEIAEAFAPISTTHQGQDLGDPPRERRHQVLERLGLARLQPG